MPREVIAHLVDGAARTDFLRFRDALRADPGAAAAYGELKRRLLEERGAWYSGEDKASFIVDVLVRAPHAGTSSRALPARRRPSARCWPAVCVRRTSFRLRGSRLGQDDFRPRRGARPRLRRLVTSPTFTIGHRYAGAVDVSHLDPFRFQGVSEEEWGDLEPYFEGAVVFVECPSARPVHSPSRQAGCTCSTRAATGGSSRSNRSTGLC